MVKQNRNNRSTNALKKAPVAINKSSQQGGRTAMRYKECERVLTVPGSVAYAIVGQVPLNPGLAASFPWLSGHANLYDKYKVHSVKFRYKNLKGTGSDGNILLSFDYDTLDPAPSSAINMTQSTRWIDGSPWRIFELTVPADGRKLFTRSGGVFASDLKTYDMGRLWIAAEGCADASDHGYLEVEYDIELYDKSPTDSGAPVMSADLSEYNLSANTATTPIAFNELVIDGLGLTNTAGVFTNIPPGSYLVQVHGCVTAGSTTLEFELNAAAMVPPAQMGCATAANGGGGMVRYVEITSLADSIAVTQSGGSTMLADHSVITFQRV